MQQTLPKIRPDQVIAAIDRELARAGPAGGAFEWEPPPVELQTRNPVGEGPVSGDNFCFQPSYRLEDFLDHHDEAFVINAYRGLLKRYPDPAGLGSYLDALRAGLRSKIEILGRLRYSPEGRIKRVKLKGLLIPFLVQSAYHLPVFGYWLRFLTLIPRLPGIVQNFERFEAHTQFRLQQLSARIHTCEQSDVDEADLRPEVSRQPRDRDWPNPVFAESSDPSPDSLQNRSGAGSNQSDRNRIAAIEKTVQRVGRLQEALLDQERLLVNLMRSAESGSDRLKSTGFAVGKSTETAHLSDALRRVWEDRCYRSRAEIKKQFRVFLPHLEQAGAGTSERPLLDLGCGLGEWLELLKENGLQGIGVDRNRIMIEQCDELGLDGVEGDLFDYLRARESASLGGVTVFRPGGDLEWHGLVALVDEIRRVLVEGGLVILGVPAVDSLRHQIGWPSPANARQPALPPEALKFLLEQRGFSRVEIIGSKARTELGSSKAEPTVEEPARSAALARDVSVLGYKS